MRSHKKRVEHEATNIQRNSKKKNSLVPNYKLHQMHKLWKMRKLLQTWSLYSGEKKATYHIKSIQLRSPLQGLPGYLPFKRNLFSIKKNNSRIN